MGKGDLFSIIMGIILGLVILLNDIKLIKKLLDKPKILKLKYSIH